MSGSSWRKRFLHGLTASEEELYAESVRDEGAGATAPLERGRVVTITGRLTTVVVSPASKTPTVHAELFDGDVTVTLTWIGRGRVVGIEPGRRLVARGRVSTPEPGRMVVFNPWYELIGDADDA